MNVDAYVAVHFTLPRLRQPPAHQGGADCSFHRSDAYKNGFRDILLGFFEPRRAQHGGYAEAAHADAYEYGQQEGRLQLRLLGNKLPRAQVLAA